MLEHQSLHDELTGIGNRRLLVDRLGHELRQRPRTAGVHTALLMIDLDGFKAINDALGHSCGDEVLTEAASRLSRATRPGDTVARLGGDEFAVVVANVHAGQAARAAARITEALHAPITVNGHRVSVSASVGIHLAGDRADVSDCLKKADLAMYAAKRAGGNRYAAFQRTMPRSLPDLSRDEQPRGILGANLRVVESACSQCQRVAPSA